MKSEKERDDKGRNKQRPAPKGCYFDWLEAAEKEVYKAWNKDRRN